MKIIDGFMFYNELDLLYYRLSILYDIVDYFIIVEATKTYVGKPKQLYYQENKDKFAKFADKIIHIIDDQLISNVDIAWKNEQHQRNYIDEGIKQLQLEPDDKIIISDVDEIPDPNSLKGIKETEQIFNIKHFVQDFYYYNLTCKYYHIWGSAKMVSYNAFVNLFNSLPHKVRTNLSNEIVIEESGIEPGGWHLSYFGDPSYIRNKIENFSHQELDQEIYKNEQNIANHIANYSDLYFRGSLIKVPISENTYLPPEYETYLHMFLKK